MVIAIADMLRGKSGLSGKKFGKNQGNRLQWDLIISKRGLMGNPGWESEIKMEHGTQEPETDELPARSESSVGN